MKNVLRNIFFTPRLGIAISALIVLFITSFYLPFLFIISKIVLVVFFGYCAFELFALFSLPHGIIGKRVTPHRLSNGDDNLISISIENRYDTPVNAVIIDELPIQFQYRKSYWDLLLDANDKNEFHYSIKPNKRGSYQFGALVVLASIYLNLFRRRFRFDQGLEIPVYPSFVHLRKYELVAFGNVKRPGQIIVNKKLGHGMEFEQIKEYVQGDPPRWLNWKATAKRQSLMVNQFTDELSKDIWVFVDKGRLMKMPFDNLSLLDYSINAALAVSHIAIKSGDHVGLLTFSNKLSNMIQPSKRSSQMPLIMESLYAQRTRYMEADYELMTKYIKTKIRRRSLVLLFTNFETLPSFRRNLAAIRRLVRLHVVVLFFFENTEMTSLLDQPVKSLKSVYTKAVAEEFVEEKQTMITELKQAGVYAMMVKPNELSLGAINKYLEIKSRGLL